jgi:Peptidase family M23
MMTTNPKRTETEGGTKGRSSRPVALGKVNLLLALLGLLLLIGAYRLTLLPEALALLVLTVSLVTVVSRAWHARQGGLEYGLLRHPFRRELRPYLLQCLNHWLFWALFGAAILAGTFALVPALVALLLPLPLPDRIPYPPLVISLSAIGTVFLAIQLVRIYTPPADPVAIDPPLAGECAMLAGGRSALISHHYRTPIVSNAVDFVRLDEEGRGHNGDPKMEKAWYGFGEPVLSPADGTVVSVTDIHPDEPVGNTGQNPSTGNHILLDIGGGHYAVLAHLQQGSARVSEGERVRLGQQIAAVGDSGDSLVPHLHLQVQDSPDFGEHVRTVPIVFRNVVLIRAGRESTPAEADLRRGDHIRRIGD